MVSEAARMPLSLLLGTALGLGAMTALPTRFRVCRWTISEDRGSKDTEEESHQVEGRANPESSSNRISKDPEEEPSN
jgi:hypothetical protein